jgi:hypothetical protein
MMLSPTQQKLVYLGAQNVKKIVCERVKLKSSLYKKAALFVLHSFHEKCTHMKYDLQTSHWDSIT